MVNSRPSPSMRPLGSSWFWVRSAFRTSSTVRLYEASFFGSSQTRTENPLKPPSRTRPTPSSRSSCGFSSRSAYTDSSIWSRNSEFTLIHITGSSSGLTFSMIGSSICSDPGSSPRMELTLSRTSCVATSMSRSRVNSAMIWAPPEPLMDSSRLMPWMVLTFSSIGSVTSFSTTSGLAPGNGTWMFTTGGSTSGSCRTGNRFTEITPNTTSAPISITAITGRSMLVSLINIR